MSDRARDALLSIGASLARRFDELTPFRAIVSATSGGRVQIQRLGAATAETELYARVAGFDVVAGDEVLCLAIGGKPVVIGKLQRAAASGYALESGLTLGNAAADKHTIYGQVEYEGGTGGMSATVKTNAGVGATASINSPGSESAFTVSMTTGTGPASGLVLSIGFGTARANNDYAAIFVPLNVRAHQADFRAENLQTTGFDVYALNTPVASVSHAHKWLIAGQS